MPLEKIEGDRTLRAPCCPRPIPSFRYAYRYAYCFAYPFRASALIPSSLPPMAFFTPVKFLNKYEVRVGNTKYLYTIRPTNSTLYELRDRESDPDYDADETWTFRAWCGVPSTNEEHLRVFREAAAGRQKADGDCLICMEPFNLSDHKAVSCPYCETAYCRTCIQTCLLQDTNAQCQEPACRKTWTDEFLRGTMTKTFMMGPYTAHREKLLIDQERARLPESQEDAQRYRTSLEICKPVEKEMAVINKQIKSMPETVAYNALREKNRKRWTDPVYVKMTMAQRQDYLNKMLDEEAIARKLYEKATKSLHKKHYALRTEAYTTAKKFVESFGKEVAGETQTTHREANKSKWTFTMRCPALTCEGFVGLDWVCGLCSKTVCKDCRECVEGQHICDDAKVASVKALAKEAKPCPKCAAMISKIDGCDQMWCTQCHTAFSWRTGAVETYIHNPHYYQWMRQTGQHLAPVPQAAQQGADAAPACVRPRDVVGTVTRISVVTRHAKLSKWIERAYHTLCYAAYDLEVDVRTQDTRASESKRVLRVMRLVKEIDDDAWGKNLQQLERASNKSRRLHQVYDMFSTTVADMLRPLYDVRHSNPESVDLEALLVNMQSLGGYVDAELGKIKREFNMSSVALVTPKGEQA